VRVIIFGSLFCHIIASPPGHLRSDWATGCVIARSNLYWRSLLEPLKDSLWKLLIYTHYQLWTEKTDRVIVRLNKQNKRTFKLSVWSKNLERSPFQFRTGFGGGSRVAAIPNGRSKGQASDQNARANNLFELTFDSPSSLTHPVGREIHWGSCPWFGCQKLGCSRNDGKDWGIAGGSMGGNRAIVLSKLFPV